eukprot:3319543-Amphidinium_carterae.1
MAACLKNKLCDTKRLLKKETKSHHDVALFPLRPQVLLLHLYSCVRSPTADSKPSIKYFAKKEHFRGEVRQNGDINNEKQLATLYWAGNCVSKFECRDDKSDPVILLLHLEEEDTQE